MANVVRRVDEQSFQVLPSTPRAVSPDTYEFFGIGELQGAAGRRQDESSAYAGLVVVVDVTATAATTSTLTVSVQGVDEFNDVTWEVATTGALSAVGQSVLRVHPALDAAGDGTSDLLPPRFRIVATHSGAESFTYSVSGHLTY